MNFEKTIIIMTKQPKSEGSLLPAVDPRARFQDPEVKPYRVPGMKPLPVTLSVTWKVSPEEDVPLHVQFPGLNNGD